MRKALIFTAFDRPDYFFEVLESWRAVRGKSEWDVFLSLEPSNKAVEDQQAAVFLSVFPDGEVHVNDEKLGVLHHPWVAFTYLFQERAYEFVVRAEDDLVVSSDILEYFAWAAEHYEDDQSIATVHGYTEELGESDTVRRVVGFQPWIWGTWAYRWEDYIGPTWDHDYSTNNGQAGVEAGWDWNLNKRIFPAMGVQSVYPTASRVNNIGVFGTHANGIEMLATSASFQFDREKTHYREIL